MTSRGPNFNRGTHHQEENFEGVTRQNCKASNMKGKVQDATSGAIWRFELQEAKRSIEENFEGITRSNFERFNVKVMN